MAIESILQAVTTPQAIKGIGAGLKIGAQIGGGIAGRQAAQFQAGIARQNAVAIVQQAQAREVRLRREQRRRIGLTRASFGAAGVQLPGTPLDVLAEQALEAEEDAQLIRFGGRVRAREQLIRASVFEAQGRGSILGGFSAAGGTFLRAQQAGAFGDIFAPFRRRPQDTPVSGPLGDFPLGPVSGFA